MISYVPHMAEPSMELPTSYIANNYINNTYFMFTSYVLGENTRETPKVLTCSLCLYTTITSVYEYLQKSVIS